jgi:hypothetical protein
MAVDVLSIPHFYGTGRDYNNYPFRNHALCRAHRADAVVQFIVYARTVAPVRVVRAHNVCSLALGGEDLH